METSRLVAKEAIKLVIDGRFRIHKEGSSWFCWGCNTSITSQFASCTTAEECRTVLRGIRAHGNIVGLLVLSIISIQGKEKEDLRAYDMETLGNILKRVYSLNASMIVATGSSGTDCNYNFVSESVTTQYTSAYIEKCKIFKSQYPDYKILTLEILKKLNKYGWLNV